MLTVKSVNVEAKDWEKLKKISKKSGVPMSHIIREAIRNYIEAQKGA